MTTISDKQDDPANTGATMRAAALVIATLAALLVLAGCSESPATTTSSADSCRGSGCGATLAPQFDPMAHQPTVDPLPAATPAPTENVTIVLSVSSVRGDFGGYIVNLHDGKPAKQTTFNVDKAGKWSKTITVPNVSMVKLDIARIGATCEIKVADTGQVLVKDENSCIVGS